eukprot:GHRR01009297.1.p1 GENE.GHRR01009297.1~~GHRR01009297.1.p1  ORF type:complete len:242 (+),score=115.10 GHRR01009297.1:298-1023(+)
MLHVLQASGLSWCFLNCYMLCLCDPSLLQGEREFARDNKSLGTFRLDGIPPAPRGVPQIEVKFDIDANGILSVTATDKGTGKKQDIKITGASVLPKDEVERMVGEAERFAAEDKSRRDAVEAKNGAESLVYQTEKQLKELGEKVPEAIKTKVEEKIKAVRDAVAEDNTDKIKAASEALQKEMMEVGTAMYQQAGAAGQAGPSSGPGSSGSSGGSGGSSSSSSGPSQPGDDNVIDAEFTDKQ